MRKNNTKVTSLFAKRTISYSCIYVITKILIQSSYSSRDIDIRLNSRKNIIFYIKIITKTFMREYHKSINM